MKPNFDGIGEQIETTPTRIVSGYADIIYYDGPVLWHGKNQFGQRVVGSDLYFNRETITNYCMEALVSGEVFDQWSKREISYADLLRASDLYLIKVAPESQIWFKVKFDDLPEKARPTEEAMCPEEFDVDYVEPETANEFCPIGK